MFSFIILIACAMIFYRIGNADYGSGVFVCGLSIGASILSLLFLPIPFLVSVVVGQVLLFVGLTIYNVVRNKPPAGF
jgi:multisubunit Na+/H+ antiporter MnhE subunit